MSIKTTLIKPTYESKKDDIINEFYIPLLTQANYYKRVSAYFSSEILKFYARGIEAIGLNNGKIQFLFSHQLEENDFSLMQKGIKEKFLVKSISEKVKNIDDTEEISNLAYLLSIGLVEIKIAFSNPGIFHDKFGFIGDDYDEVYFRGSTNETVAALKNNAESFETSLSWIKENGELSKIKKANIKFNEMWSNNYPGIEVVNLPDVIKEKILKFNKKKLIFNPTRIFINQLVLDINDKKKVFLLNNLEDTNQLDARSPIFKSLISPYIESVNNNLYYLRNIGYIKIQKFIDELNKYAKLKSIKVNISSKLLKFLESKNLFISKRKSIGIEIKEQGEILQTDFKKFKEIVSNEISRPLNEHQLWNSYHLVKMIKAANFSVPGTGKTAICYGAFAYLSSNFISKVDKIIVIGPISSFLSWKDEFNLVFAKKKKLFVLDTKSKDLSSSMEKKRMELRFHHKNYNLILINYDSVKALKDILHEIIDERTLLIFDEVHKVKNPEGKRAQYALEISKNANHLIILTGTPIPNTYVDIYNLLKIMYPDEYDSFFGYSISYLKQATNYEYIQKKINEDIYPFFCRITKRDLKIPPPNIDELVISKMNEKENELFQLIHRKFNGDIFSLFLRLSQASNNPKLLLKEFNKDDDIYSDFEDQDDTNDGLIDYWNPRAVSKKPKFTSQEKSFILSFNMTSKFLKGIDLVTKLVKDGKKVVVWGIFVGTLIEINRLLDKSGIRAILITGSTNIEDREAFINEFKNGSYQVLITNPHTLGESVSLHKYCHDAVYFEFSFNLVHMLQSKDRIHRFGLSSEEYTQYHYLFLENDNVAFNSIDKRTFIRLKEKEDRMLNSIEQKVLFIKNGTYEDDILFILNQRN